MNPRLAAARALAAVLNGKASLNSSLPKELDNPLGNILNSGATPAEEPAQPPVEQPAPPSEQPAPPVEAPKE